MPRLSIRSRKLWIEIWRKDIAEIIQYYIIMERNRKKFFTEALLEFWCLCHLRLFLLHDSHTSLLFPCHMASCLFCKNNKRSDWCLLLHYIQWYCKSCPIINLLCFFFLITLVFYLQTNTYLVRWFQKGLTDKAEIRHGIWIRMFWN